MSDLLRRLNKDHVRLRRLMDILEAEAGRMTQDPASQAIVRDILDYMTSYPDRFHHPLEDSLFDVLESVHAPAAASVQGLRAEHTWIRKEGRKLLSLAGAGQPSTSLRSRLTRYAHRQRQHMREEEGGVFETAARTLGSWHWQQIRVRAEPGPDPLFGQVVQERYRDLYAHIMRSHSRGTGGRH